MKLVFFLATLLLTANVMAADCKGTLASGPKGENFCFYSIPEIDDEVLVSLGVDPSGATGDVWNQAVYKFEALTKAVKGKFLIGSTEAFQKSLKNFYGAFDAASAATGNKFSGKAREALKRVIFEVDSKKSSKKNKGYRYWKKRKFAEQMENVKSRVSGTDPKCMEEFKHEAKVMARSTFIGPVLLRGLGLGAVAGASVGAGALYGAMSLGPEYPMWLVNLFGRELYKLPLATLAPAASAIALGVGAAVFLGHQTVVITRLVSTIQAHNALERAVKKGQVKKSFIRKLERKLKGGAKVIVRGWDHKEKKAIIGKALKAFNSKAVCGHDTKRPGRIKKRGRRLSMMANYLAKNPDYLTRGGTNESSYEILENGAGKFKVDIQNCPTANANVESITMEDLVIDEREMTTGADWDYRVYGPGDAHYGSITIRSRHGKMGKKAVDTIAKCFKKNSSGEARRDMQFKFKNLYGKEGKRVRILRSAMKKGKNKGNLNLLFKKMEVTEENGGTYSPDEMLVVLGFKVEIDNAGSGSDTDTMWETCSGNAVQVETDSDDVDQLGRIQVKFPSLYNGKNLVKVKDTVRPKSKKWKRTVTIKEILKDGAEGKVFTYEECYPERYVFPAFSASGTGNLYEEINIKPIRLDLAK